MTKSKIEWTEATWNPLTGCTKISPGCKFCYAERMAKRLQAMSNRNYKNGFDLALHEHMLELPLKWKKPRIVFVNSMSDMFHEDVPISFIQKCFDVMRKAHWHEFQILSKRADRLQQVSEFIDWPNNVWMGVSVENCDYTWRIDCLRTTNAFIKFLSIEPLLGPIDNLELNQIDWVIVGGESGPRSRIMKEEWVINIRDQCLDAKVPFFFKQWGGTNKKKAGRLLECREWNEMPPVFSRSSSLSSYQEQKTLQTSLF